MLTLMLEQLNTFNPFLTLTAICDLRAFLSFCSATTGLFRDSRNTSIQHYCRTEDAGMSEIRDGGFVEVEGGLGCPCYLGALIISVIKPSGNTCMAWIIHRQLQGHSACFIFSLWPSELANLSQESEDVREASEPIWIRAPTSKWEV